MSEITTTIPVNMTFAGVNFWSNEFFKSDKGYYYQMVDGQIHSITDPTDPESEPIEPIVLKKGYHFNLIYPNP